MDFQFDFTQEKLGKIIAENPEVPLWYKVLCDVLPLYDINTVLRVAAFLAQCGHESSSLTVLQENLNYSAQALQRVFPEYFPDAATARQYARKKEMIANRVYANRMGNGNEESGDGWKYRGRGIIQITGKENYQTSSFDLRGDDEFVQNPELLLQKPNAVKTACWFWKSRDINMDADNQDIEAMTRKINGGLTGLDDRKMRYQRALEFL